MEPRYIQTIPDLALDRMIERRKGLIGKHIHEGNFEMASFVAYQYARALLEEKRRREAGRGK